MASLLYAKGSYDRAQVLYRRYLKSSQRVLGKKHPDTLIAYNNLANLYFDQGRRKEARKAMEETLRLHREVLGENHLHHARRLA